MNLLLPLLMVSCTKTVLNNQSDPRLSEDSDILSQDSSAIDTAVEDCIDDFDLDGRISDACEGGSDCNDTVPQIFSGAIEFRDQLDNDCDGQIDEDNLLVDNSYSVIGEAGGDLAGSAVSGADIFGDGYADVIVTSPSYGSTNNDSGKLYFQFVTSNASSLPSSLEGYSGSYEGEYAYDQYATGVALLQDVDGDGLGDMAVGIKGADQNGNGSGALQIYRGEIGNGFSLVPSVVLAGESDFSNLGAAVTAGGDLNGDGLSEVLVGSYAQDELRGSTYVYWGNESLFGDGQNISEYSQKISGTEKGEMFSWSLAGGGDVSGDGLDDFWVGAPGNSSEAQGSGAVYLVTGSSSENSVGIENVIYGDSDYDQFGYSIAMLIDADGDGKSDLVAGAPYADFATVDAGAGYLFLYGLEGVKLAENAQVKFLGSTEGENVGFHVAGLGDINADQLSDFAVGSLTDLGGSESGAIWLHLGRASWPLAELGSADVDARFLGTQASMAAFSWPIGNINGEEASGKKYDDFAISAPGYDDNRGRVTFYSGQATTVDE